MKANENYASMVQTLVSMIGTNQHDIIQKLVKKAGEKITSAEKHTLECETNLNEARKAAENLSKKTNKNSVKILMMM